jgi:hypothetical protein
LDGFRLCPQLPRPLRVDRLAVARADGWVTTWSTINLKGYRYSVPSSLIGEKVVVRLYEERIEVLYGGELKLEAARLCGQRKRRIDYRHVIWSLVKKPGAFARYKYRLLAPVVRRWGSWPVLPRLSPLTGLRGVVVTYFQTPVRRGKHWIIKELDGANRVGSHQRRDRDMSPQRVQDQFTLPLSGSCAARTQGESR